MCFWAVLACASGGTVTVCRAQQARGMLGRGEDLGRCRSRDIDPGRSGQRSLPINHPVVAVFVVGGDPPELVAGRLGGLAVMGAGFLC